jgi:peptidoglycan hydrolase-like protein with peptidoglycan-binding domain
MRSVCRKYTVQLFAVCIIFLGSSMVPSSCFAMSVSINQKLTQADPTNIYSAVFTVVFSKPIQPSTFTATDISLASSTASTPTVTTITEVAPNNGTTFEVTITAAGLGTVQMSIPGATYSFALTANVTIPTGGVQQMLAGNNGDIFLSYTATDTILKVDASGTVSTLGSFGFIPKKVAFGTSTGDIFAIHSATTSVYKMNNVGSTTFFGIAGLDPRDIEVDALGNVFVLNRGTENISKITSAGITSVFGTTTAGNLANDMTIFDSGKIVVVYQDLNDAQMWTPAGIRSVLVSISSIPISKVLHSVNDIYVFVLLVAGEILRGSATAVNTYAFPAMTDATMDNEGSFYVISGSTLTKRTADNSVSTYSMLPQSSPDMMVFNSYGDLYTYTNNTTLLRKRSSAVVTGVAGLYGGGNATSTAQDASVTFAVLNTVTVNQATTTPDPYAGGTSASFIALFSTPIVPASFTARDVSLLGSTAPGAAVQSIVETAPYDGTTFTVTVTASGAGTLVARVLGTTLRPEATARTFAGDGIDVFRVTASGTAYVLSLVTQEVRTVTSAGIESVLATIPGGYRYMTLAPDGTAYFMHNSTAEILAVSTAGVQTVVGRGVPTAEVFVYNPIDAHIYTAGNSSDNISKINVATGASTTIANLPGGTFVIRDMVIDTLGNILIGEDSGRIFKMTPTGTVTTVTTVTAPDLTKIVRDSQNALYSIHTDTTFIKKTTPAGVVTTLSLPSVPRDIAIDSLDILYVTLTNGRVYTLTPQGVGIGYTVRTTSHVTRLLAVDALGDVSVVTQLGYTNEYIERLTNEGTVSTLGNGNALSTSLDNSVTLTVSSGGGGGGGSSFFTPPPVTTPPVTFVQLQTETIPTKKPETPEQVKVREAQELQLRVETARANSYYDEDGVAHSNMNVGSCDASFPARAGYNRKQNPLKIKEIVKFLNKHQGEKIPFTGLYHTQVVKGIQRFQKKIGLPQTGEWGPKEHDKASYQSCGWKPAEEILAEARTLELLKSASTTTATSTGALATTPSIATTTVATSSFSVDVSIATTTVAEKPTSLCRGVFTQVLQKGTNNSKPEVRRLQKFLTTFLQVPLETTGVFGPETEKYVIQFQKKFSKEILQGSTDPALVGVWGPRTLRKANTLCK